MSYLIHKTHFYYGGTLGIPSDRFLTDGGVIMEFDSIAEAEAHIAVLNDDGVYVLAQGEYARPEYSVVTGVSPECVDAYTVGDEAEWGTCIPVADVPESIREQLLAENVEWSGSDGDTSDYTAELRVSNLDEDGDEVDTVYTIVYTPKNTALQLHADDLGELDWDFAKFFVRED